RSRSTSHSGRSGDRATSVMAQKAVEARCLKQADAAPLLEVGQPRVSDLLQGRIDLFNTDMLIDKLARLGIRVRLVVRAPRAVVRRRVTDARPAGQRRHRVR